MYEEVMKLVSLLEEAGQYGMVRVKKPCKELTIHKECDIL